MGMAGVLLKAQAGLKEMGPASAAAGAVQEVQRVGQGP